MNISNADSEILFINEELLMDSLLRKNEEEDGRGYTWNRFYVSSINQLKFTFFNKLNKGFYPAYTTVQCQSFAHKMRDAEVISFSRYDDPLSASSKLKPFQTLFNGRSRQAQDVWSFVLSFWLPGRFKEVISSLELEEVIRFNSSQYYEKTPLIRIDEWQIDENGKPSVIRVIDDQLGSANTTFKKYSFDI